MDGIGKGSGRFSPWLRLARWLVIGYAVIQLCLALVGIVRFPAYARQHVGAFTANDSWNAAQSQLALQELGWPPESIGWFDLGRDVFFLVFCYSLGFILLRRKSTDWFGLYLALVFFLIAGNTGTALQPAIQLFPALDYIFNQLIGVVAWQFLFILFFLFPNGKPVPGWTRWMILAWLVYMVWGLIDRSADENPILGGLAFVFVFSAIGSQVFRYWKVSSPAQKQQTKWVVYVLVCVAVIASLISSFAFLPPASSTLGRDMIVALLGQFVLSVTFLLVFLSILVAILRYRLYDIDLVIRRTLLYTLLTGFLALVYFGGVVLLQAIFGGIAGQPDSPLIIVSSTLLIAALFNPLRRRIQDFIDRSFYRRKYNAQLALENFAEVTRVETDLSRLSAELVGLVQEAFQPDNLSLWLADGGSGRTHDLLEEAVTSL